MSLLTGPGRNSEMSVMMSSKVSRPDLPTSSRWPGDSIWKHPEGLGRRDQLVGRRVVERHLRPRRRGRSSSPSVRLISATACAIDDCIRMPSTSSLSSPRSSTSSLSNWLIGKPGEAGLDRGAVEQRGVGEQHAAGVHRDVARQPVEPLDELEHQVEPGVVEPAGPQLGQLAQRDPGVAGPDVRERLGDRVDLPRRHAERGADVADRVADPVGVHHRDADAPLAAVAVEDPLVDLEPARRLHVDVDVGQRLRAAARGTAPSAGRAGSGRPRRRRAGS